MVAANYASTGSRIAVVGGIAGIVGGTIFGGSIEYVAYSIVRYVKNQTTRRDGEVRCH